jgi:hypothetical protein
MGENLGSRFARMTEEERRRFALEQEEAAEAAEVAREEVEFDDPRRDHARTKADLEDRDGAAAQLDEQQHERKVEQQTRDRDRRRGRSG